MIQTYVTPSSVTACLTHTSGVFVVWLGTVYAHTMLVLSAKEITISEFEKPVNRALSNKSLKKKNSYWF